ncbi:MAG: hypothetical protein HOP29_03760 [Phycisphaerales bacterium]|nr:hypothetical protein [Phycisphaerales bacterium]
MARTLFRMFCTTLIVCHPAWSGEPSSFATRVVDYNPAPGHFVQDESFNDPARALGPPIGGGLTAADNSSVVTLGGFGGSITLGFDHTVLDDPLNPIGLDAIVFGNAFWRGGEPINPNVHWAECGVIEICRDWNENGQPDADEPWYLIPGSHIANPAGQFTTWTWDDNVQDATYPPANPAWIPPGYSGTWRTSGYLLPAAFNLPLIVNPFGSNAEEEGIFGYADYSPVLKLGDWDADDVVDDRGTSAAEFYTIPDDPFTVGIRPGSCGGDAIDIAWAIDPASGEPADLDGFDFIRITNGVNALTIFGEKSPELDAVADVAPGIMGDYDADNDVDMDDYFHFHHCTKPADAGDISPRCRVMDFDDDLRVGVRDFGRFQTAFTGGIE